MRKSFDYIVFILMLAFTTFEYFFREDKLFFALGLYTMIMSIHRGLYRRYNIELPIIFVCIMSIWFVIQLAFISHFSAIQVVSPILIYAIAISVSVVVKERFVSIFVKSVYYISVISLVIYFLCLNVSIRDFLINTITPYFTSLNVETAVFEGGGKNFIIYNFVSGGEVLEATGLLRNCGPFWEPGMFAVFLNIALFLHNVIEKQNLKWCNLVLISALVTTFSAGGFVAGLFVLLSYAIATSKKNYFISIIGVVLFVFLSQYVMKLEYVGEKVADQIENTEEGSDLSRFGAFLTQISMIENNPILGGEKLSDYVTDERGTLASGTLLPIVAYGIPFGSFYVIIMLFSMIRLSLTYKKGRIEGILLFLLILFLSFSQTILLAKWMTVIIFVGLMKKSVIYER